MTALLIGQRRFARRTRKMEQDAQAGERLAAMFSLTRRVTMKRLAAR